MYQQDHSTLYQCQLSVTQFWRCLKQALFYQKENDWRKKLHITKQQEKELYKHLTYLLWGKK